MHRLELVQHRQRHGSQLLDAHERERSLQSKDGLSKGVPLAVALTRQRKGDKSPAHIQQSQQRWRRHLVDAKPHELQRGCQHLVVDLNSRKRTGNRCERPCSRPVPPAPASAQAFVRTNLCARLAHVVQ